LNYTVHQDAKSYMIIESVTNTTSKTIHVINFTKSRKVKVVSNFIIKIYRVEHKMLRSESLILAFLGITR
jgi:hypothetical protein